MAADIDTDGTQVGTEQRPFSGTLDGDGHTLTYNKGVPEAPLSAGRLAPFGCLSGATLRHLNTTGSISSTGSHSAGIAVFISGSVATTLYDCQSNMDIYSTYSGSAAMGGLVAEVKSGTAAPSLEKCMFNGVISDSGAPWGGLVGLSNVSGITFKDCMFDPSSVFANLNGSSTYVRLASGKTASFQDCYCTYYMGTEQATCVFSNITVPTDCTWEMVDEPALEYGGKSYWKSGARVRLTMPEGTEFDHWTGLTYPGEFISDAFRMNGVHRIEDIKRPVSIGISTTPIPTAETERTLWGVVYRYLSRKDYHFFFSDETLAAKGWVFENDNLSDGNANLIVRDSHGDASEITVVTGYNESDYDDDGVQIHNDLVSALRAHTHLGLIAPRAFNNSTALKTLYFKDADANTSNALLPFDFEIGDEAFANCPNLTEVKMMQYTTEGSNTWEKKLTPTRCSGSATTCSVVPARRW